MLSDNDIEKLMKPIIDRQEMINDYVIRTIAKRVKEIGELLPSDVYKLKQLLKSGADVRKINKEIARLTKLNENDIKKLIKQVAKDGYLDTRPFFDYRKKPFITFEENKALQNIVSAVAKQTSNEYMNLSKSQAFMIRDLKNPKNLKPTSIAKTYQSVIDEAVQATQSGVIDYNTAMRRTLKQLADSGIRNVEFHPESGRKYTQRLDTAVRRNILDGVRAINQGVQDEVGKQYGADGKEITVHANSAPDHEPIQGHQFTNEEYEKLQNNQAFKDLNGRKFEAIKRPIGVLNCRHFTYSIICGVNKPNFTQKQLDEMIEKNQKGYTAKNGKHYTMYECTQEQRKMETEVRKAKQRQMTLEESGDIEGAKAEKAKVVDLQKKYSAFSKACGLSMKTERLSVNGYK
jgi:hypothetical protein